MGESSYKETNSLTRLRESLLPKLLSGELSVDTIQLEEDKLN